MRIEKIRKELLDKAMRAEGDKITISKDEAIELHIILTEIGKFMNEIRRLGEEKQINAI